MSLSIETNPVHLPCEEAVGPGEGSVRERIVSSGRAKRSPNSDVRSAVVGVSIETKSDFVDQIVRCEKQHQDIRNAKYFTLKSIAAPLKTNPPLLYMWGKAFVS